MAYQSFNLQEFSRYNFTSRYYNYTPHNYSVHVFSNHYEIADSRIGKREQHSQQQNEEGDTQHDVVEDRALKLKRNFS